LHFTLTARNDGGRNHAALHDGVFDLAHLEFCVEIGFHYRQLNVRGHYFDVRR
jgi:hypothetical protein